MWSCRQYDRCKSRDFWAAIEAAADQQAPHVCKHSLHFSAPALGSCSARPSSMQMPALILVQA